MTADAPTPTPNTRPPNTRPRRRLPSGPWAWLISAALGASIGIALALLVPASAAEHAADYTGHAEPTIPLWLCIPFATLLGSIALMPFISERFWHRHFPDFAFGLGAITAAYYLVAFNQPFHHGPDVTSTGHHLTFGQHHMLHTALEYYAFIALIGGLYVASGGVLITVRGRGTPLANTTLLAAGALLANIVGTTGASVLLIRPFMRLNAGRLKAIHVVMFIFIVSNCGGALTPIGDPPLYLGYLKGVPFSWTLTNLWPMWATCIGMLLAMFFVIDRLIGPAKHTTKPAPGADEQRGLTVSIRGTTGIIALALIISGVFIDPVLRDHLGIEGLPIGATFQIAVAIAAYFLASREIYAANEFSFFPVKEVGLLFIGIFATMAPALGFLAAHGDALGLDTPGTFYFATGSLSGVLDNAPTYLNFLQVAFGPTPINSDTIAAFLAQDGNPRRLAAVSLGAVFFGAMTYIGNGPNFMVRAIAESSGLRMPSFFGYCIRSLILLLPVLTIVWLIFFRG